MPISAVLSLIPETDVTLRPTMGHHAHAAFLSLLRIGNPEKAKRVHESSGQKPFTVSPLIGKSERRGRDLLIRAKTACWMRFTFLDDALLTIFGDAFFTQKLPSIRLGHATFHIDRIAVGNHAEQQQWSGNATYANLLAAAEADTHIHLRFYSPTAFRTMTPRGQKSYNHTQIDLVRCYQSWINRWNAFAPVKLEKTEFLAFIAEHARLSQAETKTRALDFGRHTEIGWVGRCTCHLDTDDAQKLRYVLIANCLADFAFYCGTGYKTTMGMGQTKRLHLQGRR